MLDAKIGERVEGRISDEKHAAAITAVTAVRAAFGHVFLATETQATVAAVARDNAYRRFIDKFHVA